MVNVRPMRIPGRWHGGYVLDYHTVSSTYIGDNSFGHPMFDTKRTEIGELLFRLKNRSDYSVVDEIAETAADFVNSWKNGAALILPVAPSGERARQPVYVLADALGKRVGIPVEFKCLMRAKKISELKNIYDYHERLRLLEGAHTIDASTIAGQKVPLFDDLYRSGATMNSITELLYNVGVLEVHALAISRTRSRL